MPPQQQRLPPMLQVRCLCSRATQAHSVRHVQVLGWSFTMIHCQTSTQVCHGKIRGNRDGLE